MEFETVNQLLGVILRPTVKIYSVGIWNLELSTLKNEDIAVKIYSVGIWNDVFMMRDIFSLIVKIYSVGIWNRE